MTEEILKNKIELLRFRSQEARELSNYWAENKHIKNKYRFQGFYEAYKLAIDILEN